MKLAFTGSERQGRTTDVASETHVSAFTAQHEERERESRQRHALRAAERAPDPIGCRAAVPPACHSAMTADSKPRMLRVYQPKS
jgi:hypothetical protein